MNRQVSSARLSAALLLALGRVPACESMAKPGSPNPVDTRPREEVCLACAPHKQHSDFGLRNHARQRGPAEAWSVETLLAFLNGLHCGISTSTLSSFLVPHGLPI